MASILDQYEEESARAASRGVTGMGLAMTPGIQEPIGSGFLDARIDVTEMPIFNKKKVNFKPPDPITHLVVSNNFLVMAMTSNILQRLDLEHPDTQDEVELPKPVEDRIYKIFLDPTGKHLIISMESSDNFYLSRNSKKPRPIGKLKGHNIDSVGWNWQNANENTTGSILLGTSRGFIFETELSCTEDGRFFQLQGSIDQYLKQIFNLSKDVPAPVTSLEFDRIPTESMNEYKYYILATTPGRLYQFVGTVSKTEEPPMFQQLFQKYESSREQFLELPGNFGYSELKLFFPKFRGQAKTFAWMTGPGILYGDVDASGAAGTDSVTGNTKLLGYPKDMEERGIKPMSILLTEFHVLILYNDRMKAVCLLNEQPIYDDNYPDRFGKILGLCKDPLRGTIWTYTSQAVFRYNVVREDRDVWQMYLDRGEFNLAKEYCKRQNNPVYMDRVLTKQAAYMFGQGKYEESALLYAETQNSFEEIALKFIKLDEKDALKYFLQKKLMSLKQQDKTQMTMLVTWLIEIFLNQLGEIKDQGDSYNEAYERMQFEFQKFLAQGRVKECVSNNRGVVYDLIASHGDVEDMVYFAVLMQDFERVISHHIQHENFKGALDILKKQSDMELYYKFSPLLMQYIPKETVDAWITAGKDLDPKKLIPALVQYDAAKNMQQGNEAIRYLKFCIQTQNNTDQAIHNYLLSLYAALQPDALMTYLQLQGQEVDAINYDLKYALRQCMEHGHKRACVHIYSLMSLHEEAVDLALSVDVELAKEQANRPDDDDDVELKKKLWLRIARHVVEEEKDIRRAMEFLHECDLLKIEDILPFFPDFVTIDHFKDAIIQSLQEYNQHIESLKDEMEEATKSAEEIRKEIQSFRNKFTFVKAHDKCSSCSFPILTRGFYVFPCQHMFHSDCLIAEVLPNLSDRRRNQVEDLQRKLAEKDDPRHISITALTQGIPSPRELDIKAELDDVVAAECIYCGDFMIRSIDKPFVDESEEESAITGWL